MTPARDDDGVRGGRRCPAAAEGWLGQALEAWREGTSASRRTRWSSIGGLRPPPQSGLRPDWPPLNGCEFSLPATLPSLFRTAASGARTAAMDGTQPQSPHRRAPCGGSAHDARDRHPGRRRSRTAAASARSRPASASSTTCSNSWRAHGLIDIRLQAKGDLHIDFHHTTEDSGLALGQAVREGAGRTGPASGAYGHALLPMDETLTRCALDISGRPLAGLGRAVHPRQDRRDGHRAVPRMVPRLRPDGRADPPRRDAARHQQPPYDRKRLQGARPRPARTRWRSIRGRLGRCRRPRACWPVNAGSRRPRFRPFFRGRFAGGRPLQAAFLPCGVPFHADRDHRLRLRQPALGRQGFRARGGRSRPRGGGGGDGRRRSGCARPTGWCCPASAPSPIARRGWPRWPGMIDALEDTVIRRGPAVPRHLRRHAADGGRRAGARRP